MTKFPAFVTGMGKGSVDEQNPSFGGVYVGAATKPDVKKAIESSDCVLVSCYSLEVTVIPKHCINAN